MVWHESNNKTKGRIWKAFVFYECLRVSFAVYFWGTGALAPLEQHTEKYWLKYKILFLVNMVFVEKDAKC